MKGYTMAKIFKQNPRYWVENFGIIAIDEECSWMEDEQYFVACEIISLETIKVSDNAVFYYEMLEEITKTLKLMPGALNLALTMYLSDEGNKVDFDFDNEDYDLDYKIIV